MNKAIFGIIFYIVSVPLFACTARLLPSKDFGKYESIYIAEVTGIRLTEYQKSRVEELRKKSDRSYYIGVTPEYELTVLPQKLRKGKASEIEVVHVSGCGIREPKVREVAIFFVKPDGRADVLFNIESYNYEEYIEAAWDYYREKKKRLKVDRGTDVNKD